MVDLVRAALLLLHGLAGAAWFGSIFYGVFVLYPRVSRHFENNAERERLLLALSFGVRWHMIAAMTLVALSGVGLALTPHEALTQTWLALIGAKVGLMLASTVLFWRVSWYWWPARLFALESELPTVHRRFRLGAACMLVLVGLNLALGILASNARSLAHGDHPPIIAKLNSGVLRRWMDAATSPRSRAQESCNAANTSATESGPW